jgi:hypothetical protein
MSAHLAAAKRLHHYLSAVHWREAGLRGPDPGVRLNYRVGRFIKGYLSFVPWRDSYYYLQAQGYWALANWRLASRAGNGAYRSIAAACADSILAAQRPDGAWDYPNPEWRGRVATAEGTWASLGLVESYRQTGKPAYLDGARRWHHFLIEQIGFQGADGELAVNYFAGRSAPRVPNNSLFVLRLLAELAEATGDSSYLGPAPALMTFVGRVQRPDGELPYGAPSPGHPGRQHFQCFQYHAFQCLDLARYYELSNDEHAHKVLVGMLGFLGGGLAPSGDAYYDCGRGPRTVTYHTAALAAAFTRAGQLGISGYEAQAARAYAALLAAQRPDGGFPHSRGDYGVFSDRRSYPRYLAMILFHLLEANAVDSTAMSSKEGALNRVH